MIKVLLTGDWHCGDVSGLTPPTEQKKSGTLSVLQGKLYDWFEEAVATFGPYDMTIFTGDMTEGEGKKGTIELYETDTERQAEIAAECAEIIPCSKANIYTVYGTPFHTTGTYSYENHFCDTLGIKRPKTTQRINIADLVRMNVRHVVGRSSIPYGQGTPTLKELTNEMLNAVKQDDVSADVIVRGHAHLSMSVKKGNHEAIVVPCLKYPESIFGRRLQEGDYDMGFGVLEIYGYRDWIYKPVLIPLNVSQKRDWEKWEAN